MIDQPEITKAIGMVGGLILGFCGARPAYATVRKGGSIGTPIDAALMIFSGVVLIYTYLCLSYGFDGLLAFTYITEIASWGLICWYHFFPRKVKAS